jgi:hypothetical protein
MSKILSVAASGSGKTNLDYTPQFVGLDLSSTPGTITRLTINQLGGGGALMDIDEDGFKQISTLYRDRAYVDGQIMLIPLGDGFRSDSCFIQLTTGAGATVDLYGFSMRKGNRAISTLLQRQVANTTKIVKDFIAVGGDYAGADTFQIGTQGHSSDLLSPEEVAAFAALDSDNSGDLVVLPNFKDFIDFVQMSTSAGTDRNMIVHKFVK